MSEVIDDQIESGLNNHINKRRKHLQSPFPIPEHHLEITEVFLYRKGLKVEIIYCYLKSI